MTERSRYIPYQDIHGKIQGIVPYLYDSDTGSYYPDDGIIKLSPFTDIDTSFSYNPDGTIAQIVMTGLSQTKTLVFSYGGGNITSIACVIT
jgi:hypothetical protein